MGAVPLDAANEAAARGTRGRRCWHQKCDKRGGVSFLGHWSGDKRRESTHAPGWRPAAAACRRRRNLTDAALCCKWHTGSLM